MIIDGSKWGAEREGDDGETGCTGKRAMRGGQLSTGNTEEATAKKRHLPFNPPAR